MAVTEADIRRGFDGLANWVTRLEAMLAAHTPGACVSPDAVAAVAAPGETLSATLDRTLGIPGRIGPPSSGIAAARIGCMVRPDSAPADLRLHRAEA